MTITSPGFYRTNYGYKVFIHTIRPSTSPTDFSIDGAYLTYEGGNKWMPWTWTAAGKATDDPNDNSDLDIVGEWRNNSIFDLIYRVRTWFEFVLPSSRIKIMDRIMQGYCRYCGEDRGNSCNCYKDE